MEQNVERQGGERSTLCVVVGCACGAMVLFMPFDGLTQSALFAFPTQPRNTCRFTTTHPMSRSLCCAATLRTT